MNGPAKSNPSTTRFLTGTALSVDILKGDKKVLLPRFVDAVKRLHARGVDFEASPASDVISGYPIEGMADLLPAGVPQRAYELQGLLRQSLGAFEPVVGCHNDLAPSNCIVVSIIHVH